MGDSIATNMFMLGYAWQKGLVPLSRGGVLERAIELNGVAVETTGALPHGAGAPRTISPRWSARPTPAR